MIALATGIGIAGLLTFLMRAAFIVPRGLRLSPAIERALRFVPSAVLAALVAPALAAPTGALNLSPSNARLLAGIVALVVAWRTRNVALTLIVGMGLFWLASALFQH